MDIDKDFSRNVWCLLDIPFDTITFGQAVAKILSAFKAGHDPCFLPANLINLAAVQNIDRTTVLFVEAAAR